MKARLRRLRLPRLLIVLLAYIVLAAACNVGLFEHSSLSTHTVSTP